MPATTPSPMPASTLSPLPASTMPATSEQSMPASTMPASTMPTTSEHSMPTITEKPVFQSAHSSKRPKPSTSDDGDARIVLALEQLAEKREKSNNDNANKLDATLKSGFECIRMSLEEATMTLVDAIFTAARQGKT